MKTNIIDIKDMSDSRELLESRPHDFLNIFTYILIIIIIAALSFAYFAEIDVYIKASGIVRPNEKISIVRNVVAGKIETINIEEWQFVKQGDILYTIEKKNIDLQLKNYNNQKKDVEEELINLEKYKKSINTTTNLFNNSIENEATYYLLLDKYILDRKIGLQQISEDKISNEQLKEGAVLSLEAIHIQIENKNIELSKYERYKESVLNEENLFTKDNADFYNRFEDYILKYENLKTIKLQTEKLHDKNKSLFNSGIIPESDFESSKQELQSKEIEIEKLKQAELLYIEQNIERVKQELLDTKISIKKAENTITTYANIKESSELLIEKNKIDLIAQINESIKNNQETLKSLNKSLDELELQLQDTVIRATKNGYINMLYTFAEGDSIQNGIEIATIIPETEDKFKIDLVVSNKDIANVKVGQKINFKFLALPYQEYGMTEGEVINISMDIKTDNITNEKYYLVETSVLNKPIENYKGENEEIKVGMLAEGQVVSESKKILFWLLEKIDLME